MMRVFLCICGFWILTSSVVVAARIEQIEMIGDEEYTLSLAPSEQHIFLGTLDGQPHLYVLPVTETTPFELELYRHTGDGESVPLSIMIVVERFPRGVEAIARLRSSDAPWTLMRDTKTRIISEQGHMYRTDLEPGTYRIEVSTPTNQGRYELRFGEVQKSSWWTEVKNMRILQRWYEISWWQSLLSPLIYMPLTIIILLGGIGWLLWRRFYSYV